MIKRIIKRTFEIVGLKIERISNPPATAITESVDSESKDKLKEKLLLDPLNSNLHFQLAIRSFDRKNIILAFSELKTAEFLGLDKSTFKKYKDKFLTALPSLEDLDHNVYYRMLSLKNEIFKRIQNSNNINTTILDVGGGSGLLAAFIPGLKYCLADPSSNYINGVNLPFADKSFDLVVSCHVLEHIPLEQRDIFLDQLITKSRKGVILLNPIDVPVTLPVDRMELFIDITNASWAKEHLECSLPTVSSIKDYAQKRNLNFYYSPNGTLTTSMAYVFVSYFASMSGKKEENKKINNFFNTKYFGILNSNDFPNAGLFYLEK